MISPARYFCRFIFPQMVGKSRANNGHSTYVDDIVPFTTLKYRRARRDDMISIVNEAPSEFTARARACCLFKKPYRTSRVIVSRGNDTAMTIAMTYKQLPRRGFLSITRQLCRHGFAKRRALNAKARSTRSTINNQYDRKPSLLTEKKEERRAGQTGS